MNYDVQSPEWSALTRVTPNNVEKFVANMCVLLGRGVILTGVTATVSAGALSSVSGVALSHDRKAALWFIHAAATEEEFGLTLTVTTNDGQTLVFPVQYVIG